MEIDTSISELHFSEAPDVGQIPGPNSRRFIDEQSAVEASTVAYPKDIPIAFSEAKGATIRDVDGNTFLDFFSGIGVLNVGHSNPYVLEGVDAQMHDIAHTLDFPTEARIELLNKLNEIAPLDLAGNSRITFGGPTGANAIEASIKLAKHNTGGTDLIAFEGGYHGRTVGAFSLTAGKEELKQVERPLLPNVTHVEYPNPLHQGTTPEEAVESSLAELQTVLEDPSSDVSNPAGIWVEAIQGEGGGVLKPPSRFLPEMKQIAEDHGIPLIVDEIQTGFGRTGEWFASEHSDTTPDVVTLGKALGGIGLPLSAVLYHEDLDAWGRGAHTGTFRGFTPAMRAGLRAIEYIEYHDLLNHSHEMGEHIRSRLAAVAEENSYVGDVRGEGLFVGVELYDPETGTAYDEMVTDIQQYCYEHGVLVWTAGKLNNVVRLIPPLVVTHEQVDVALSVLTDAFEEVAAD